MWLLAFMAVNYGDGTFHIVVNREAVSYVVINHSDVVLHIVINHAAIVCC